MKKKKNTIKKKQSKKKSSSKKNLSKKKSLKNNKSKNIKVKKKKLLSAKIKKKKLIKKSKKDKIKLSKKTTLKKVAKIKKEKKIIKFEDYIEQIVTKLIQKHKVDGIYTPKIIEKAVPKKFRVSENVEKLKNVLKSNKLTILTDEEAAELIKSAKDEQKKSENDDFFLRHLGARH